MKRKRPKRKPKPGLDTLYFKSLNALVDSLFSEAFHQRLSWEDMAKKSGLARETIHRLGTRVTKFPQFRTVELLANALGGRIDFMSGHARKVSKYQWTPKVFRAKRAA